MKRLLAILLVACFLATASFSSIGCGKKDEPKKTDGSAPAKTEASKTS